MSTTNCNQMEEKIEAIRKVILKRRPIIERAAKMNTDPLQRAWYDGRVTGLMDVYDLLGSSLESINIELEDGR